MVGLLIYAGLNTATVGASLKVMETILVQFAVAILFGGFTVLSWRGVRSSSTPKTVDRRLVVAVAAVVVLLVGCFTYTVFSARSTNTAQSVQTVPSVQTVSSDRFNEQMAAINRDSDKLDNELEVATSGDVKNQKEAVDYLTALDNYQAGVEDIFVRQAAVFTQAHKPMPAALIEQQQAELALHRAVHDMYSYLADPANNFHQTADGRVVVVKPDVYSQKKLAFRAASARFDKANAALALLK
jgi:uncharacterized membrane protein YedE/YeeE